MMKLGSKFHTRKRIKNVSAWHFSTLCYYVPVSEPPYFREILSGTFLCRQLIFRSRGNFRGLQIFYKFNYTNRCFKKDVSITILDRKQLSFLFVSEIQVFWNLQWIVLYSHMYSMNMFFVDIYIFFLISEIFIISSGRLILSGELPTAGRTIIFKKW